MFVRIGNPIGNPIRPASLMRATLALVVACLCAVMPPPAQAGEACTPAFPLLASRQTGTERAIERALKATNLILQSGGFGLVVLDLADAKAQLASGQAPK